MSVKMTLLEMTQNILSATSGDEVNAIGDTVESEQVALEIKNTYYENLGNLGIASRYELVQFDALVDDTDHPHMLKVKEEVDHFDWVKYNIATVAAPDYQDVEYLDPKTFMDYVLDDTSGTQVTVKDLTTDLPYKIRSDKAPDYWTSFDDEYIIFDSYNVSLDDTIQESKVMAYSEVIPAWSHTDTFVPDLNAKRFPMLLAEAKSACFINYNGVSNTKEEQRSRRQKVTAAANHGKRFNGKKSSSDFGRS